GTSTNGYYQEPCIADPYGNCYGGGSGGSDPGCGYKYIDEQSCRSSAAVSDGCYWGNKQETCYASGPAQCSSLGGGCRWTSYPDLHRSCTSVNYQSGCTGVCTWGPR